MSCGCDKTRTRRAKSGCIELAKGGQSRKKGRRLGKKSLQMEGAERQGQGAVLLKERRRGLQVFGQEKKRMRLRSDDWDEDGWRCGDRHAGV